MRRRGSGPLAGPDPVSTLNGGLRRRHARHHHRARRSHHHARRSRHGHLRRHARRILSAHAQSRGPTRHDQSGDDRSRDDPGHHRTSHRRIRQGRKRRARKQRAPRKRTGQNRRRPAPARVLFSSIFAYDSSLPFLTSGRIHRRSSRCGRLRRSVRPCMSSSGGPPRQCTSGRPIDRPGL